MRHACHDLLLVFKKTKTCKTFKINNINKNNGSWHKMCYMFVY